jgi:hypothetical protein
VVATASGNGEASGWHCASALASEREHAWCKGGLGLVGAAARWGRRPRWGPDTFLDNRHYGARL